MPGRWHCRSPRLCGRHGMTNNFLCYRGKGAGRERAVLQAIRDADHEPLGPAPPGSGQSVPGPVDLELGDLEPLDLELLDLARLDLGLLDLAIARPSARPS